MNRNQIFEYVKNKYNTIPEYCWENTPLNAVLRHSSNNKWYGIVMNISKDKLGLYEQELVDILNVKCPPEIIGGLRKENGFFPAYHMNKEHWITILLDGSVKKDKIIALIDFSHELTEK